MAHGLGTWSILTTHKKNYESDRIGIVCRPYQFRF